MTIQSWLRNLTHGPRLTRKTHRPRGPHTRKNLYRPSLERLEERALLAYDLGFAFAFGSTGSDNANYVATDSAENVIVAGSFTSASLDLDPGPGEYLLTNAGGYRDGFAAKYDATGNLLWGVQMDGTGDASAFDVAVDGSGNVLLTGPFAGSMEIGAPGQPHITLTNSGIREGFLAKIDPAGNALWATTFGAAADPRFGSGITADAAGNVYATGYEGGTGSRLFVAKYSAGGTAVWTKVVSGGTGKLHTNGVTSFASGADLAVDASSNVYVTGTYAGKIDFNPDPNRANTLTSVGGPQYPSYDAFVLKLNATGTYVWAGSMGGNNMDGGRHVAVDGSGNVLVHGDFYSSTNDFNPGGGTLNLVRTGGGIGTFVVKLDPNRNLIWGRSVVGSFGMALDAAGNVYTTGPFSGTIDADPGPGTFNLTAGGAGDMLVSKLDSSGNFVWAADILTGGPGSSGNSFGIAVDGSGNVYTSGSFHGTVDFDPGAGTYSLTSTLDSSGNPSNDAFVSKLVPLSALQAAGGTATHATGGAILSTAQVTPLLAEALASWQAAGVNTSALDGIDVRIADLGGATLGLTSGHTIWLDDNAAGWGWYVDATPGDDSEFTTLGNQGEQHRMDLLTVVMHELGHLLGYEHDATGVMSATLAAGIRHTPGHAATDWLFAHSDTEENNWLSAVTTRGDHRKARWVAEKRGR